jgi:hypothetical protein
MSARPIHPQSSLSAFDSTEAREWDDLLGRFGAVYMRTLALVLLLSSLIFTAANATTYNIDLTAPAEIQISASRSGVVPPR